MQNRWIKNSLLHLTLRTFTFEINEEVEKVPITVIAKEEVFDIKEEVGKIPIAIIIKKEVKELAKIETV